MKRTTTARTERTSDHDRLPTKSGGPLMWWLVGLATSMVLVLGVRRLRRMWRGNPRAAHRLVRAALNSQVKWSHQYKLLLVRGSGYTCGIEAGQIAVTPSNAVYLNGAFIGRTRHAYTEVTDNVVRAAVVGTNV